MNMERKFLRDITAENIGELLCSMSSEGNCQQELIFPDGMIESICHEKQYPCYKFAHNLEKEPYMRARLNRITLEYLVKNNQEKQNQKEAYVLQIVNNGQRIYFRPEKPTGIIYVI